MLETTHYCYTPNAKQTSDDVTTRQTGVVATVDVGAIFDELLGLSDVASTGGTVQWQLSTLVTTAS